MLNINPKIETSAKIMANVLHDLNPSRTVEEWEDHVNKTGHDPKLFFGDNGTGYEEYMAFVRTYDRDTYERRMKKR